MHRLIQTAAALLLIAPTLVATGAAHAETAISVTYRPEQLATTAGVQTIKAEIAKAADAYCRAHPVEHTVAECRQVMGAQMSRDVDLRAVQYARANPATRLAQR